MPTTATYSEIRDMYPAASPDRHRIAMTTRNSYPLTLGHRLDGSAITCPAARLPYALLRPLSPAEVRALQASDVVYVVDGSCAEGVATLTGAYEAGRVHIVIEGEGDRTFDDNGYARPLQQRVGYRLFTPADLLIHSSPAELLVLLRRAQAERDALLTETLKLESRLTIAEVAIHTAQQEDRAPIWPPACDLIAADAASRSASA